MQNFLRVLKNREGRLSGGLLQRDVIIHQQAQVSSFETFHSNPGILTILLLSEYIEQQPSSQWYSSNWCWKMLSLFDLVTTELPQNRSCPKLPVAYQFSHRAM